MLPYGRLKEILFGKYAICHSINECQPSYNCLILNLFFLIKQPNGFNFPHSLYRGSVRDSHASLLIFYNAQYIQEDL